MAKKDTVLDIAFIVGTFPVLSETFIANQIGAAVEAGQNVAVFSFKKGNLEHVHPIIEKYQLLEKTTFFKNKPSAILARYTYFLQWFFTHIKEIHWSNLWKAINVFTFGKKAMSLTLFYESQWFLVRHNIDVVHIHFGRNAEKIARLKSVGFLKNVPLITTFHGFDLIPNREATYQKFYKTLLKEGNLFTVNTLYMQDILKKIVLNHSIIKILPVGLDTNYFAPSPIVKQGELFHILFCGRLIALKGPLVALQIMKALVDDGYTTFRLKLIGHGTLYEDLDEEIKKLELTNYVSLLGSKTQDEVLEEMKKANVLLMPGIKDAKTGRAETQGLVIQEAQALEKPVIVSDVGGMKYGLLPDISGYVIPEGDVDSFKNKLAFLMKNPAIAQAMGQKGRSFVVENYDSKVLHTKLMTFYKELLQSKTPID